MKGRYWLGRAVVYYLLVLVVLRIGLGPFSWYFPQSDFFAEVTRSALFDLVDNARQNENIHSLEMSPQLNLAAYQKAQDMLAKQYFAHYSPEGTDPWHWFESVGYRYRYAGENLAIHFVDSAGVYQAWMVSDSHRSNILNADYQEMGMAVVRGEFEGRMTTLVVQLFGTPSHLVVQEAPVREEVLSEEVSLPIAEPETIPELVEEPVDLVSEEEVPEAGPVSEIESEERRFQMESDWQIASATSVVTDELSENRWFLIFKFWSRSYEDMAQQMIFYGILLISFYFAVSLIRRPEEGVARLCGQTALWALLILILSLLTKETVLSWISYQINIG